MRSVAHWRETLAALAVTAMVLFCGAPVADAAWSTQSDSTYTYWKWNGVSRFRYASSPGVWHHYSTYGGWQVLSATGRPSNPFVGDGTWRALANGWDYWYGPNGLGYWRKTGSADWLLAYSYAAGSWAHHGSYDTGTALSAPKVSCAFVGIGTGKTMGNGWDYSLGSNGLGYWKTTGSAVRRFAFNYTNGRWYQYAPVGTGWYLIGAAARSSALFGDGQWHALGNGLSYSYAKGNNCGYFRTASASSGWLLAYSYTTAYWYRYSTTDGKGHGLRKVRNPDPLEARDQVVCDYVFDYVNEIRRGAGLAEFQYSPRISIISRQHSINCAVLHQFAHTLAGAPTGWKSVEDRFTRLGWTGWGSGGQVGENLYVIYHSQIGDYEWGWDLDGSIYTTARGAVYNWVYNDASSNWGHRYPIMDEDGWHLHYSGVGSYKGVITMDFSERNW